jgi:integrase
VAKVRGVFLKREKSGKWYWKVTFGSRSNRVEKSTGIEASESAIRTAKRGGDPDVPPEALQMRDELIAELEARKARTELQMVSPKDFAERSVADVCDERIAEVRYESRQQETDVKRFWRNVREKLGHLKVRQLAVKHTFLAWRDDRAMNSGLANVTINREVRCIKNMLESAELWHVLVRQLDSGSYSRAHARPRLSVPKGTTRPDLSEEAVDKLIETAFGLADVREEYWVVGCAELVASMVGVRSKEIREVKLGAIHWMPEQCNTTCKIQPVGMWQPHMRVGRETTKTDAGTREIPLNTPIVLFAVRKLWARATDLGATKPEHHLFPRNMSRYKPEYRDALVEHTGYYAGLPQKSWQSAWTTIRKKCGLPDVHFHDLRHYFRHQCRVHADGGQAKLAMEIQGWIDPSMLHHYDSVPAKELYGAMAKMAGVMTPAMKRLLGDTATPPGDTVCSHVFSVSGPKMDLTQLAARLSAALPEYQVGLLDAHGEA